MAEAAPEAEWRTSSEIADGVPFDAQDRDAIIANRQPPPAPVENPVQAANPAGT
jgi:hypothetical protein